MTTEQAFRICRGIARREAKNFYWSFRVLPRPKSDAMCAVYAFMRQADDLADDESRSVEERRESMAAWVERWRSVRAGAETGDPVFVALRETQRRFAIPDELLEELVAGTTMDLQPAMGGLQTYSTFEDLYRYCYLVASVVGLVVIRIFGYTDKRAEGYAIETGVAFQLTNILRDVQEDALRGRVYLPVELMEEFNVPLGRWSELAEGRVQMGEKERALLATVGVRAERYYLAAGKLIPLLDADSRAAMWVLTQVYHRLLARIADREMNVFGARVSVPTGEKLRLLLQGVAMAARGRMAR